MRKKKICFVCGEHIAIKKDLVYLVREREVPVSEMFVRCPVVYDAMDCPHCGCQQLLAARLPKLDVTVIEEVGENDD